MKCVICGSGECLPGTTTVTLERGNSLLVLRAVPAQICQDCGESYMSGDVSKKILTIARDSVDPIAEVDVRQFDAA